MTKNYDTMGFLEHAIDDIGKLKDEQVNAVIIDFAEELYYFLISQAGEVLTIDREEMAKLLKNSFWGVEMMDKKEELLKAYRTVQNYTKETLKEVIIVLEEYKVTDETLPKKAEIEAMMRKRAEELKAALKIIEDDEQW